MEGFTRDLDYAGRYRLRLPEVDVSFQDQHTTNSFSLKPRNFVLAWTHEEVVLPFWSRVAARVEGKSSLARLGVSVHVTAPTIHSGFEGHIQLELYNFGCLDIILTRGMRVCQLIFEETLGTPAKGYKGQFSGIRFEAKGLRLGVANRHRRGFPMNSRSIIPSI